MSEEEKNSTDNEFDEIGKLLEDYKKQRDNAERGIIEPLEPPKRREDIIDFAKTEDDDEAGNEKKASLFSKLKKEKPEKSEDELAEEKAKKAEKAAQIKGSIVNAFKKIFKALFNRTTLIIVVGIALIIGVFFGIRAISSYSETAYLKPYEKKYPDVKFSTGILEKYCDTYGQNPDSAGYIEIPDLNIKTTVAKHGSKTFPEAEACTQGSETANYVVYLEDNKLEKYYKNSASFNSASGYVTYTDYYNEYNFMIVGAFYTNTNPSDDNNYAFPYNVTEKMTAKSTSDYISKLESRFVFDTGVDITRGDMLLTLSCPTDYRKDYRFVVIGVARKNTDTRLTATDKEKIHYQQCIYDEMGIENPYKYSTGWYPEIIVNDKAVQKTAEDYNNK